MGEGGGVLEGGGWHALGVEWEGEGGGRRVCVQPLPPGTLHLGMMILMMIWSNLSKLTYSQWTPDFGSNSVRIRGGGTGVTWGVILL